MSRAELKRQNINHIFKINNYLFHFKQNKINVLKEKTYF